MTEACDIPPPICPGCEASMVVDKGMGGETDEHGWRRRWQEDESYRFWRCHECREYWLREVRPRVLIERG